MKEITKTIKTYEFDELPTDIQNEIVEENSSINLEDNWWEDTLQNEVCEIKKKVPVIIEWNKIVFNLDRGSYFGIPNGEIEFDEKKIIEKLSKNINKMYNNGLISINIESNNPNKNSGIALREFPSFEWKRTDFNLAFSLEITIDTNVDNIVKIVDIESKEENIRNIIKQLDEIINDMNEKSKIEEAFEKSLPFISKGLKVIENEDEEDEDDFDDNSAQEGLKQDTNDLTDMEEIEKEEIDEEGKSISEIFDEKYHSILDKYEKYIKETIVDSYLSVYEDLIDKLSDLHTTIEDEYKSRFTRESIVEEIKGREWVFTLQGKRVDVE